MAFTTAFWKGAVQILSNVIQVMTLAHISPTTVSRKTYLTNLSRLNMVQNYIKLIWCKVISNFLQPYRLIWTCWTPRRYNTKNGTVAAIAQLTKKHTQLMDKKHWEQCKTNAIISWCNPNTGQGFKFPIRLRRWMINGQWGTIIT